MEAVKQVDMTDAKRTVKAKTGMLTEAQRIVKKLAMPGLGKPGYPAAMFLLANAYGAGLMLLRANHEKAFHLYVQGSKQHHPACTYRAGVCYELGIGTRKNNAQASQFYRKAANLGDPAAMYKLAMMLLHGLSGHGKHPKEAISWLKRAVPKADPNYPEILHELAIAYEKEGIPSVIPDVDYSRELFTKAALIGYAPSQYRLGLAFENGMLNCPVDARLSIAWYSKSAAQGHFDAALALSGWYLTGAPMIMPQDDREAYLWARKTAELGYPKGQFACGYYCETGIGVEQSLDQAIFWYKQAANQQYARAIQRLEELKSPKATRKKQNRLRHHHQDQSVATTTTIIESPVLPSPTLTSKHARRLSNLLSLNTNTSPTLPILSPSPMTAQKPTNEDNCIIM
ncbi:HCP-like protein [Gongronella butleri]|nr:HCP-like protein [Gongronella butleri]